MKLSKKQNKKKGVCPKCGEKSMPIVYGLPGPELWDRDDIVLGGCVIFPGQPDFACENGHKFRKDGKLVKSSWLNFNYEEEEEQDDAD